MGIIEKSVFISYRRTNAPWALAIYQYLTRFGYDVFYDFNSIDSGDFEQIISENIRARAHFLVLLTPSAIERCNEKNDWLRREIEIALESKRNIIPILLENFDFGDPETKKFLPEKLVPLKKYSGLPIYADYFDAGMERLCNRFLKTSLDQVKHPEIHPVSAGIQEIVNDQKRELAKKSPIEEKILSAQEWFEKAVKSKITEEMVRLYSKAIELDPDFGWAYNNRGNTYADLKQYEKAIEDYNKAIELDPEEALAYNNRGTRYADLKQYEKAIEDYNKAIELDPEYALAYYNRGNRYADLKQYEKAIEDYNKAIELDPEEALAYNNRGNRYADLKQYEKAIEDYNKAIELDPEYALAYNNRGNRYADLKQYEKAIEDYNKAIELDPEEVLAYNNRGNTYAGLKHYEKAIEDFNKAIELDPERGSSYYNLACVFSLRGQTEEAFTWLKKALVIDPQEFCVLANNDNDFDRIRQTTEFKCLLNELCNNADILTK